MKRLAAWMIVLVVVTASCQQSETPPPTGGPGGKSCPRKPFVLEHATEPSPGSHDNGSVVTVDASVHERHISRSVYGVNHRYSFSGFRSWESHEGRPNPQFLQSYRFGGFSAIRFPGGRTANNYYWRQAIGPVKDRGVSIDAAFGKIQIYHSGITNQFGPDEYGKLLEATHSQGIIDTNFASSNARDAANWVEYMNSSVGENPHGGIAWAKVRARNGHPRPYGVKYWEVGNELIGALSFWVGPDATLPQRATKYIFGGSTPFTDQPTHTAKDYSASGSVSKGTPNQTFFVQYAPVQPGSEQVYVDGTQWSRVSDLASTEKSDVYEIDTRNGAIRFGNGSHGNIPAKGSRVTVSYVSGPHDGFNTFYREMKQVDPTIKVGSTFNDASFVTQMGTTYPYDFLTVHSYSFFHQTPKGLGQLHDLMMHLADDQAAKVRASQSLIRTYSGRDLDVVISEYAMAMGNDIGIGRIHAPLYYPQSLDGALLIALLLRHWIDLGIPLAAKHTLVDIDPRSPPPGYAKIRTAYQAIMGPFPCFLPSATADVFRLYTSMMGPTEVASSVGNDPVRRIFTGAAVSALQTVASVDAKGHLYLIVINRDRTKDVTANLRLKHFHASSGIVETLDAPSFLSHNSFAHPNQVHITKGRLSGVTNGMPYTFPAHSVTALRFST
jgi:alpha-L-arabinofuranosidase